MYVNDKVEKYVKIKFGGVLDASFKSLIITKEAVEYYEKLIPNQYLLG